MGWSNSEKKFLEKIDKKCGYVIILICHIENLQNTLKRK